MSKDVYYIAGPMSGIQGYNFHEFEAAASLLRDKGLDVISAHEIEHDDGGVLGSLEWETYLRADLLAMLHKCDCLVLLDGWDNSRRATVEHCVAKALGFKMFILVDDLLVSVGEVQS